MAISRIYIVLFGIFFTFVMSMDSFAGVFAPAPETFQTTKCQRSLSLIHLRMIPDIQGNSKFVYKVRGLSDEQKKSYELFVTKDGFEIALRELNSNSEVWIATTQFSQYMGSFGYYIKRGVLYSLGTEKLNKLLLTKKGSPLERPFTFVDGFPEQGASQKTPAENYLRHLLNGKVWLATGGYEFIHDRFQEHMVANLFIPKEVFSNFQKQIEFIFGLKEIFSKNEHIESIFQTQIDELMTRWELITAEIGKAIVIGGNGYDIFLDEDSIVLGNYQKLANLNNTIHYWKEAADALERGHIVVTNEEKDKIADLYKRTRVNPLSVSQIRNELISQLVGAGVPVGYLITNP